MNEKPFHVPVLLNESIDGLAIQRGDTVVDGTFGGGGHSGAIYEKFGENINLICVDLDEAAKERFDQIFDSKENVFFVQSNFKDAEYVLNQSDTKKVDRVLLDLGTSTFQLLEDNRGFSFQSDTPLSMSFSEADSESGVTAYEIVNDWKEESIADIIYGYAEEPYSRKIAKAIISAREKKPIKTSAQLAEIISDAISRRGRIHPATKTFQALRITVNNELEVLKKALDAWWYFLTPGGRIAVITFHSLEDRVVKQWMKSQTNERVITKKPLIATEEELLINPRSRSAKLRIIEKIK